MALIGCLTGYCYCVYLTCCPVDWSILAMQPLILKDMFAHSLPPVLPCHRKQTHTHKHRVEMALIAAWSSHSLRWLSSSRCLIRQRHCVCVCLRWVTHVILVHMFYWCCNTPQGPCCEASHIFPMVIVWFYFCKWSFLWKEFQTCNRRRKKINYVLLLFLILARIILL